jgi:cytochrome c-type biogenesis protein CcmH/NrfG
VYSPLWRSVFLTLVLVAAAAGTGAQEAQKSAADFNTVGVQHYAAGEWQEAIDAFSKAMTLMPDNGTVRRNLCNAYQSSANELAKKADFASAADLLETAITVDPKNASPLVQLGSYYLRLNMTSEATFRLKEALELDPDNLDGHELLGDAYYRANNLEAALTEWETVAAVKPNRPGLREKLDKAYRESSVESRFGKSGSRHFQVSYAQGITREEQLRLLTILERAYIDIGQKFSGVYPPSPVSVIIYTADQFTAATQLGEHVGALYDGKIRVPLKDKAGHTVPDDELRRRLYHEYTHVVVRFLADDNAPWWLNEGLAETFSRSGDDQDTELLRQAAREGKLLPLAKLSGDMLTALDVDTLRLAYAEAHAAVSLLWDRFGPATLSSYMTALAEGTAPEEALQQCYRRNYALLDREVTNQIARQQ